MAARQGLGTSERQSSSVTDMLSPPPRSYGFVNILPDHDYDLSDVATLRQYPVNRGAIRDAMDIQAPTAGWVAVVIDTNMAAAQERIPWVMWCDFDQVSTYLDFLRPKVDIELTVDDPHGAPFRVANAKWYYGLGVGNLAQYYNFVPWLILRIGEETPEIWRSMYNPEYTGTGSESDISAALATLRWFFWWRQGGPTTGRGEMFDLYWAMHFISGMIH